MKSLITGIIFIIIALGMLGYAAYLKLQANKIDNGDFAWFWYTTGFGIGTMSGTMILAGGAVLLYYYIQGLG